MDEGDTAKLTCSFYGTPEPTVQWYKDSVPIASSVRCTIRKESGTHTLVITDCVLEDSGCYKCEAVNEDGKAETQAQLTVEGRRTVHCCLYR